MTQVRGRPEPEHLCQPLAHGLAAIEPHSGDSWVAENPVARFEGRQRTRRADEGIDALRQQVDSVIVIPNDRLLTVSDENTSVISAFQMADEVLLQGVQGITDLITTPGLINTDFADVKMVLTNAGSALMGIGQASGDERAVSAAKQAISSPLLESAIDGARGVLLNITGPSSMGLFEMNAAAEVIHGVAHQDANIIFGTVIDDEMGDEVKVTVRDIPVLLQCRERLVQIAAGDTSAGPGAVVESARVQHAKATGGDVVEALWDDVQDLGIILGALRSRRDADLPALATAQAEHERERERTA